MVNSKHQRHMRAIAQAINSLECAHIDLRYQKQGSAGWHYSVARLYDATAELIDLGVPMTLGGFHPNSEADGLRADAASNRDIAARLEREAA